MLDLLINNLSAISCIFTPLLTNNKTSCFFDALIGFGPLSLDIVIPSYCLTTHDLNVVITLST